MAETWETIAWESNVVLQSLADAANDFIVASADNTWAKKTLAETGAILEGDMLHDSLQSSHTAAHVDQDVTSGSSPTFGQAITDNHVVTVDGSPVDAQIAIWNAAGLESITDANLIAKLSADAAAAFDWGGQNIQNLNSIYMVEQAVADAEIANSGQLWVKTGAPCELWFTDDAGTDTEVALVGGVATGHALLDGSVHTDTAADAVTRGSIIYANATPAWDELVKGAADTFLGSDGTDVSYRTAAQVLASLSEEAGAAFDWGGQELQNWVNENVADDAAKTALTQVVGMQCFQVDEGKIRVCTVAS